MDEAKKAKLDRRFALLFETAKRSLLAADNLAKRITADLESFEPDIDAGTDIGERAVPALMNSVAFVDFAFRFNEVVDSLPFIRKDTPEIKKLGVALKPVEDSRHHLQHMRGDLSSNEEIDYPLLGALSWVNGMTTYSISFSQPGSASFPSIVFDTHELKWVMTHAFVVKHVYIDIDLTLAEMHAAYAWICSVITSSDPSLMELKWGGTLAIAGRFEFRPKPLDGPEGA